MHSSIHAVFYLVGMTKSNKANQSVMISSINLVRGAFGNAVSYLQPTVLITMHSLIWSARTISITNIKVGCMNFLSRSSEPHSLIYRALVALEDSVRID